jgi:hypothetical protein
MLRFLALALPTAVLVLALVTFGAAAAGYGPDLGPLAARGAAHPPGLDLRLEALTFAFEATALVALFLLVARSGGRPLLDGLAAGLAAWLFQGPIVVLTIAHLTRLPAEPFWQQARVWLVALPLAGLAVGWVARRTRVVS